MYININKYACFLIYFIYSMYFIHLYILFIDTHIYIYIHPHIKHGGEKNGLEWDPYL